MPLPPIRLQKQQIILIIGVVLALLALVMIKVYLDQQRRAADDLARKRFERIQENQSAVLVAKKDIPRGAIIDADSLEAQIVPNQFVQPGAVTSLDRVAGMMTIAPIAKGEQVSLSKLTQQRGGGGLASATPAGKRAIAISVDNVSSLAGMIKSGDYVDVITVVPVPVHTAEGKTVTQQAALSLFQNVLVLAVGQQLEEAAQQEGRFKKEVKQEASPPITLALTPQEANLVAFVQEQGGRFKLVLRSPADAKVELVQPITWDTLFQYILPSTGTKVKQEPQPTSYVEIYRGLNKEKVPLYK